jgi:glycosyltransferase involved in cell wall biosynthesis
MAMEIPCVATFITGIPELIRDGLDGLLVAPSDVAALADAIGRPDG